jgi:ELWxxDGT repeat protein
MVRMRGGLLATVVCLLVACGGNDESAAPPNAPGVATIGATGGNLRTDDGAEVNFPANALAVELAVRIAKDGTGAPPLPETVTPAGAVYALTPHGGDFAAHVEITIPVERRELAANEQLLLVTANPGDAGWRVLSAATYSGGKLRAPVMKFSYFQAVILRDRIAPQLTISIDDKNNFGTDGARLIAPNEVLQFRQGLNNLETPTVDFTARLRYPAGGALATVSGIGAPAQPCLPANLDSSGAAFRFMRDGTIFQPALRSGLMLYTASTYPRTESEFNWRYLQKTSNRTAAYHFYGQDNPRISGFGNEGIALPPANNVLGDDLYSWRGVSTLGPSLNGRWRIDVTVPTDCGLFIEAAPLSFVLNLLPSQGGGYIYAPEGIATGVQGTDHRFYFFDDTGQSDLVRLEYSRSATDWEGLVASAQIKVEGPYESGRLLSATLPNLQLSAAGFYRGFSCRAGQSSPCTLSRPFELRVVPDQPSVVEQPLASFISRVGEEVSIQARIETRLSPQIRWQRRNLVLATFGQAGWEDMPPSQQTHTPVIVVGPDYVDRIVGWTTRLALRATQADHAMQYRAVFDTPYWGLTSNSTLLTVVDELAAPQITAQPASQNVLVGSTAVFVATVSGTAPLSYQWRRNGADIIGANTPTLTLNNVTALNNGSYTLVVTNRAGTATSEPAALVVTLGTPVDLPPQITAPPASITVPAGNAAGFAVSVSGTGPYTYQWYQNGQAITGNANGPSYTVSAVSSANAGQYTVRVSNSVASVLSAAATLTVTSAAGSATPMPPVLVADPIGLSLPAGVGATFAVAATGTAPFAYQWRRNGTAIAGATGAVLHIPAVAGSDAGQYSIVVTNSAGNVTSAAAGLTVTPATPSAMAPSIAAGPTSITVPEGGAANFAVAVTGTGPFTYAWRKNGTPIPGAAGAAYSIAAAAASDAGAYSVRVSNAQGSVDSASATLSVAPPPEPPISAPAIVTPPAGLAALPGTGATFAVAVTGTAPLAYQWKRNGVSISGATGPVLHIAAVSANDGGDYTVEVVNAAGTAASSAVPLIVIGAPTITQQPNAQSVAEGGTATFSVGATAPSLMYQWTRDGIAISGATGNSYTTPAVSISDNGVKFAVVVYNGAGAVFSSAAVLTVAQATAFPANAVALRANHAEYGSELWMTDGSTAGTVLVKDIWPGPGNAQPRDFTRVGRYMLFSANDGSSGSELWRSDGTAAGTVRVADIFPGAEGSLPWGLIACNSRLFFGATNGNAGVYASDGTAAGTVRLANAILGTYSPVACMNDVVYFHGATAANGSELWRSDGTAAGTHLLADIVPGTPGSNPEQFVEFQGQLYFQAANQLWRTDGTTAGTLRVSDAAFTPRHFVVNGGTLYFTAQTAEAGFEPWKTDGTEAGTVMIADLVLGTVSSFPYRFTVSNGVTFFAANPFSNAPATLWRTDGTAAGTSNLTPGLRFVAAYGDSMLDVNGALFFSAAATGTDVELYKSDGTVAGTGLVTELLAGTSGSFPSGFFQIGGLLYFSASTSVGAELWRSDGTAAGTVLVKDMCTAAESCSGNPLPR